MTIRRLLMTSVVDIAKDEHELIETARQIAKARRLRLENFPEGLFGEIGWDVLLALYSELSEEKRTTAALARSLEASRSTTMRWVDHLEEQELLVRERDHPDRYLATLRLTARAQQALRIYLARIARRWTMDETALESFERCWPAGTAGNNP